MLIHLNLLKTLEVVGRITQVVKITQICLILDQTFANVDA